MTSMEKVEEFSQEPIWDEKRHVFFLGCLEVRREVLQDINGLMICLLVYLANYSNLPEWERKHTRQMVSWLSLLLGRKVVWEISEELLVSEAFHGSLAFERFLGEGKESDKVLARTHLLKIRHLLHLDEIFGPLRVDGTCQKKLPMSVLI